MNRSKENEPRGVSVVIPTIDRASVLTDTLRDMLLQDFEDYEILIIDQSEYINQEVLAMAQQSKKPMVRYFKADFKGLPQARNFGWQNAKKDIVLYIDDDIRAASNLVRAHFEAHIKTHATMVAGGIDEARGDHTSKHRPGSFNWWTATAIRNFSVGTPGWCVHAPGGNFSVRRAIMKEIGGVDEALNVGSALYEESELALRHHSAGLRTWFEPTARIVHLAAPMGGCRVQKDWSRYMFGLAHNRSILIYRHLRWWYRPTALMRLALLGVSYCRLDKTLSPMISMFRGIRAGRAAANNSPVNNILNAIECTSY